MAKLPAADAVLEAAVELAHGAAVDVAAALVGDHVGFHLEGDRVGTHVFESLEPGYRGWKWVVTVARAPRSRHATVCEVEMMPGDGALVAPTWVPWADRLRPGDLGAQDVLPYQADDIRLDQGYEETNDEEADRVAIWELGLGRARVLSAEGRALTFTRWYEGDHGPNAPSARHSKAQCSTCGFFMKLAGAGRVVFGVCANEWSPSDGRIVSVDHGCGAHSETDGPSAGGEWVQSEPVIDEKDLEMVEVREDAPEDAPDTAPDEAPQDAPDQDSPADAPDEDAPAP